MPVTIRGECSVDGIEWSLRTVTQQLPLDQVVSAVARREGWTKVVVVYDDLENGKHALIEDSLQKTVAFISTDKIIVMSLILGQIFNVYRETP